MQKKRNKLKQSEIVKIRRRYETKKEFFEGKTLEELKEIYNTTKMSSTDKHALIMVTNAKMEADAIIKAEFINNNPEENGGNAEGRE